MKSSAAKAKSGRRLAVTLGLWILPAVVVAMATTLWFSATTIGEMADSAYDRSLAGAVRAIDANISTESGGVGVELPYNLFTFFQLTAQGAVYFNVSTSDGLVQIGDVLLPKIPDLVSGQLRFEDSTYFGEQIRTGALMRPLDTQKPDGVQITIQVAETKLSRATFQNELILKAILRDILVVAILTGLLAVGVYIAVKPLNRLKDVIDARESDDLKPVEAKSLPLEVRPLVQAMNGLMQRTIDLAEQQRRFLDDASHQLRTPMTILRTQIDYALHQNAPKDIHETLRSCRDVLDRSIRTTNQLLALAKARTSQGTDIYPQSILNLNDTAAEIVKNFWPRIRARKLECVVDTPDTTVLIRANEGLLYEAFMNIMDNAVKFAPEGSRLNISVHHQGDNSVIEFTDEGPGIAADELAYAGTRFRQIDSKSSGTGLGLAIALTVARASGGTMIVANLANRSGLKVAFIFPNLHER